jgi:DNA-binding MarR family transcriptional regulator
MCEDTIRLTTLVGMGTSPETHEKPAEQVEVLQALTRVLAGVALRSMDALHGAVTLPQFRMLSVLAEGAPARSSAVARALGLDASSVTRLADRLVAAGYVTRGSDPGHRSVVTLQLTPGGKQLVNRVEGWRQAELTRIVSQLTPRDRTLVTTTLRQVVKAAGEG